MPINPLGGIRVPPHLEVVFELPVADRPTFPEKGFDFLEDQRISLEGRRVVSFLVPDVGPDTLSLLGTREAAEPRIELIYECGKALVNGISRRAAAGQIRAPDVGCYASPLLTLT